MHLRAAPAARVSRAAWTIAALISPAVLPAVAAAQYEAPSTYYENIASTGATLKADLKARMLQGQDATSYDDAKAFLAITDANPDNLRQMFLVYDRTVVTKTSATAQGFVGGSAGYSSREHVWPDSRQNFSTANGDIHMLKPSDSNGGVNNQRGNLFFGGAALTGAARVNGSTFFAGDFDKGDVARICFYAATTYGPTLSLVNASTADQTTQRMGDLASLIRWHYLDAPDTFELRRNDVIYRGDDVRTAADDATNWSGTHNRNAYIDRPEYAWSVFMDQANDTKLSFGAAQADGSSTANVNFGRVLRGASVATSTTLTLNKAGVDGTYYAVTAEGSATSSASGRYNAFAMDATGSRSITVGLNASTATAGLKSGTVTVDNLDVTTGGGAGVGANDGDDVATLSLSVLDVSNGSFAGAGDTNAITLDFGTVAQGAAADAKSFTIYNLASALGADLTAGLDLDSILAGGDANAFSTTLAGFKALTAGTGRAFAAAFDTSSIGTFSATYTLNLSDEDLPGAATTGQLSLTLTGAVVAVPEPTMMLAAAVFAGTLTRRRRRPTAA